MSPAFPPEIAFADAQAVHDDRHWLPLMSGDLGIETTDGAAYRFRLQGADDVKRVTLPQLDQTLS